jgi:hypothetical protein
VIERLIQRVGDQSQRIEEVAVPGAVWTDQKGQGTERQLAGSDAAVVLDEQLAHEGG